MNVEVSTAVCDLCHGEGYVPSVTALRLSEKTAAEAVRKKRNADRLEFFARIWDYVLCVGGAFAFPFFLPMVLGGMIRVFQLWWVHVLREQPSLMTLTEVLFWAHIVGLLIGFIMGCFWLIRAIDNHERAPWAPSARRDTRAKKASA